jgi:hypothetical protein
MFVILAGNWITYSGGTEALGNTAVFVDWQVMQPAVHLQRYDIL